MYTHIHLAHSEILAPLPSSETWCYRAWSSEKAG